MTDGKPPPSAISSGPIAEELAEWLRAIRLGWTASVPGPMSIRLRRFYACAGSFTWLVGFVLVVSTRDPRFVNFIFADMIYVSCMLALLGLFSLWFGWLVAFADRKAGPVRLFLDGLILPAATVSIIGFSVGRVWSTSAEPAVSPPVRLEPPPVSSEDQEADSESPDSEPSN